jgi:hypothetical protein
MINSGTATPRLDLLGPILNETFDFDAYVAHQFFAPLVVEKRIGAIPSFLFTNDQILNVQHNPKTSFARIVSSLGEKTYACQEDGVEEALSKEDFDTMGEARAEALVMGRLVHALLRARDFTLATTVFSAAGESTFTGQVTTAAAAWDNASGDPYANVADAIEGIVRRTGAMPTDLTIGFGAYVKLIKNAKIQSAYRGIIGYTNGDAGTSLMIPAQTLASIFGLKRVNIAKGVYNTAKEGQTASRSYLIPSNYATVHVGATNPSDVSECCAGRMFVYDKAAMMNELCTGTADAVRAFYAEQYSEPGTDSRILRARDYVDMRFTTPEALQLIKSI